MNWSPSLKALICWPLLLVAAAAQTTPPNPGSPAPPVAYSSMSELNMMLSELEQGSQRTQADLAKMRVEKWKTDSNTKRQEQANVESIQRNLQTALPEIIGQVRNSPENLNLTFKLYRNLDALNDVFSSLVESIGAFGSKDDFQSLGNDLNLFEKSRRSFADRMDSLSGAKEAELNQLRTQIRNLQASTPPVAPKKVIVDDTEPAKKPAKKKASATKPKAATPPTATPPQ
jgi:hypothetical protein